MPATTTTTAMTTGPVTRTSGRDPRLVVHYVNQITNGLVRADPDNAVNLPGKLGSVHRGTGGPGRIHRRHPGVDSGTTTG